MTKRKTKSKIHIRAKEVEAMDCKHYFESKQISGKPWKCKHCGVKISDDVKRCIFGNEWDFY